MTIPSKFRGLAWLGPDQLGLVERNLPGLAPMEILIRVESCAICGSDLRIAREGNARIGAGRIMGHEISGTVAATGEGVLDFRIGDRVSTAADIPCGTCEFCLGGASNCCRTNLAMGYQFDGGFAEYVVVPEVVVKNGPIQKFSAQLSFEEAALAEPLACCINGFEQALAEKLKPRTMLIFGAGPIGQILAVLAAHYGIEKVMVVDSNPERLATVSRLPKVDRVLPFGGSMVSLENEIMTWSEKRGVDLIFTACPDVSTHEIAFRTVAVRGVVNLFGGVPKASPDVKLNSNFIHYREAYVTGSHGSTPRQHRLALEMLESGKVDLRFLISAKYSLADFAQAFESARSGRYLKVMIKPNA